MRISAKEVLIGIGVVLCYFCFPHISYAETLVRSAPKGQEIRKLDKKNVENFFIFHSLKNQKNPEDWGKRKNGPGKSAIVEKSPRLLSCPPCCTPDTDNIQDINYMITILLYPYHLFW
ncbi:hypothetical protein [Sinomicrobium sp. M5D2P17]